MTELVVGTDAVESSEAVAAYLERVVEPEDTIYVVNSLEGGEDTGGGDVRAGEDAIETVVDALADLGATVETHSSSAATNPSRT